MPVMSFVFFFLIIFLRVASRTPHKIFVEMVLIVSSLISEIFCSKKCQFWKYLLG